MTTQITPAVRTGPERVRVAAVVLPALAFLMVTLDALVVVTALPSIHEQLGGSVAGLQWVITAYNLTFAAGIAAGAALGDRYGRRLVFVAGLAGFVLTSAACALAPDLTVLVAFRALQGLAAAVITPVGLTLVTAAFPAERRGTAVGIWGGIAGVGVAAGPLIGGAITQGLDWRWVFWVNLPVGVVAIIGCLRALPESRGTRRPLDVPAILLIGLALASLVTALVDAPTTGWASAHTVGWLGAAIVFSAGFVRREATAAHPMVPLSVFASRTFSAASLAALLSSSSTFSAAFLMSQFFQLGRGDSPLGTGLRLLPWTVTPLLVAPLAGAWSDRVGVRRLAVPGLVLQAAGFAWLVALAGAEAPWGGDVVPFIVAGVGVSLALPTLPAAALGAVPPDRIGVGAGAVSVAQRIGPIIGLAVAAAVFSAQGSLSSPSAVISGIRWALGASAGLSLLGALVALGISRPAAGPHDGPFRGPRA